MFSVNGVRGLKYEYTKYEKHRRRRVVLFVIRVTIILLLVLMCGVPVLFLFRSVLGAAVLS